MEEKIYTMLQLENQFCFPLYVCSKEVIRRYTPLLDKIGLTYTQYISMLVLWEKERVTAKELGDTLYLDSGTLTPLLKKLEAKGLVIRKRSSIDERSLIVSLTDAGRALKERAVDIPGQMLSRANLETDELVTLLRILHKLLDAVHE